MTSRQRIIEAMRLGSPDRVPVSPFTLGALDFESSVCRDMIAKTDPILSPGTGGDPLLGSAVRSECVVDGDTTTITLHTPKGDLTARHRRTSVTQATIEFPIKTPDDVERLLSLPFEPGTIDLSEFERWKSIIGEEGLVLAGIPNAICLPATWLSPEDFCLWWADYPDLMIQLTQVAAGRLNEYVHRLCREGVDGFRIVGGEYATVQLGPSGFDKLVAPFDAESIGIIHSYGALAYYHNHGCVTAFLDKLADLGMDCMDPLEASPWGDVEIGEAVKRVGDRVCLLGNLDDMEVIDRLPEEQVVRIAEERLDAAGEHGFILGGTASGTYTERGARNFIAMAEMVRRRAQ